jgi:hypothetical protein
MYKGTIASSDVIRCEVLTTLNATISANGDCVNSGKNLWLNTIVFSSTNYNYYSCTTLSACSGTSLMFYDPNSLYSCKEPATIKGVC